MTYRLFASFVVSIAACSPLIDVPLLTADHTSRVGDRKMGPLCRVSGLPDAFHFLSPTVYHVN